MHNSIHPLDNPVWEALASVHFDLGTGGENARCYLPDILPFAGLRDHCANGIIELNGLLDPRNSFYLFGKPDHIPEDWTLIKNLDCLQMILNKPTEVFYTEYLPDKLDERHRQQLFELVNRIQPGYFRKYSIRLGNYFGIFRNGRMISVGGERMRMKGFTEISAICTDPEFTGKGFAQSIIAHLCNENLSAGNVPFLHVLRTNTRAIRIYEKMGFEIRRDMEICHFEKV